jgi:hypothetical protein
VIESIEHFYAYDIDQWVSIDADPTLRTYFPYGAPSNKQASDYLIGAIKNYEQNGYDRKGVQHKLTIR